MGFRPDVFETSASTLLGYPGNPSSLSSRSAFRTDDQVELGHVRTPRDRDDVPVRSSPPDTVGVTGGAEDMTDIRRVVGELVPGISVPNSPHLHPVDDDPAAIRMDESSEQASRLCPDNLL